MPAAFVAAWAGAGALIGAALAVFYPRLLTSAQSGLRAARLATPPLTALALSGLAWRFGHQFDLLPYSVLAALGVSLALIDLIEQRLPSVLVYSGIALVGALLATSTLLESRAPDLVRALAGMAVLAGFYLALALATGGGLGAGDVKLGGLLGLALGWLSGRRSSQPPSSAGSQPSWCGCCFGRPDEDHKAHCFRWGRSCCSGR